VDQRRTIAAFAEAVEGDAFDEAKVREAGDLRVKSAERLRDAVGVALAKLHAMLDPEQRKRLSYLLRTGALSI
jgi:Spy/CpxP family protein refolding chaperone